MGQAFERIQRWLHQRAKQAQLDQRKSYQGKLSLASKRLERIETRQQLDPIIEDILAAFRDAAYPSMQIRTFEQGWSLGAWGKQTDSSLSWNSIIDILPLYEKDGQVRRLEITGHNQHKVIGLNRQAIESFLLQVYFPRKRRDDQRRQT